MINLLPPQARRTPLHEYWARVITVWGLLIALGVFFAVAFLLPAYVLVQLELRALRIESDGLSVMRSQADDTEAAIKEVRLLAGELARGERDIALSRIIDAIDTITPPDISLSSYAVAHSDTEVATVQVEGVARTRAALIVFQEALKKNPLFEEADVPLKDLVRSQELPFTLTLTMTSQDIN